ncbi:MAG: hypothetical protein IT210_10210 [Armatimonadetes bacterium]|nr:hypothetical protein [Armatimonadota bacterium]
MMKWLAGVICALLLATAAAAGPSPEDLQRQIDELKRIVGEQQQEIAKLRGQQPAEKLKPAAPASTIAVPSGEKVTYYGFLRLDSLFDSSMTNNTQVPFFVLSPSSPAKRSNGNKATAVHIRATRMGFNYADPDGYREWKLGGKMELDWHNGSGLTAESRPLVRIRHAYLTMQRGPSTWLFGQTWDLISPLITSPEVSLMWNVGDLGDRRPQVRYTYAPADKPYTAAVALGLTNAVDAKDLDDMNGDGKSEGNGILDGEDSGLPNIQVRTAYKTKNSEFGLWAHRGWEELSQPLAGQRSFATDSVGVDWQHRITPRLGFMGELWTGRNLSDFRGGIAQGINAATGKEIMSNGGWAEFEYQTTPQHHFVIGYSADDPKDGDIPNGGRIRNDAWYFHNHWKLSSKFEVGLNYLYWTTKWKGLATGKDHRISSFIQHNF